MPKAAAGGLVMSESDRAASDDAASEDGRLRFRFSLTSEQMAWLDRESRARGVDRSDLLREVFARGVGGPSSNGSGSAGASSDASAVGGPAAAASDLPFGVPAVVAPGLLGAAPAPTVGAVVRGRGDSPPVLRRGAPRPRARRRPRRRPIAAAAPRPRRGGFGQLAGRALGLQVFNFHTSMAGPNGGSIAVQTTDPAHSAERLVLRASGNGGDVEWTLELERPKARDDTDYSETETSSGLAEQLKTTGRRIAEALAKTASNGFAGYMLCRKHQPDVRASRGDAAGRATTQTRDRDDREVWTRRRDKPSLHELSEKLTADAGLSLTFTPRDDGRFEQVQISVEINEHHTLSIDRRATREVQRSLGVMATTSWATERARFMLTRQKGREPDPEWQLNGDNAGRIVLHYLDATDPDEDAARSCGRR